MTQNSNNPHITVLLNEAVDALAIRPEGIYIDATFGRGGHSRAILAKLGAQGRLFAFDRDPTAIASATDLQADSRFSLIHASFAEMQAAMQARGISAVDGVLFDLGVSSPQLDEGERGFSFRFNAPLDMRMDTSQGETAAEWLASADLHDITRVFREYGEERFAYQIAKKIVAMRSTTPITHTAQLANLIAETVRTREAGQHPATRSFQGIRIHINQELAQIDHALPQALSLLPPQGRLVVISFHSLEDRRVKQFMRAGAKPDNLPKNLPLRADQLPPPALRIVGKAQAPSAVEVTQNPRARSAIMRVAEKL